MDLLFIIIFAIGFVIATYRLIKIKKDRKKVILICFLLGFFLIIVGAILSFMIYDLETAIDLLLLKESKIWGRSISIGYLLIISSLAALLFSFFKSKEVKN